MAAVAVMLKQQGFQISGSDHLVYPPMSTFLKSHGIDAKTGYKSSNLRVRPDYIVIGNALSRGNPEIEYTLNHKYAYLSLPELVRHFCIKDRHSIVISGTHGKTTTSALTAWMLECAGKSPGFLIGGIPLNFEQGARLGRGKFFVVEGDEYDTVFFDKRSKFLHYAPDSLIINNIEFDHGDIFESIDDIRLSFQRLINLVPSQGNIFYNQDDPQIRLIIDKAFCPTISFGFSVGSLWTGKNLVYRNGGMQFDVLYKRKKELTVKISLAGRHNIYNLLGVTALGRTLGIPALKIKDAWASFQGIKRRLEIRGEVGGIKVIDDFAHHPTAIRETLKAAKALYRPKRLWAVVEPRSSTLRSSIFQNILPQAFGAADRVILTDVYNKYKLRARHRLNPVRVIRNLCDRKKQAFFIPTSAEVAEFLGKEVQDGDVIVCMSNGGFDHIHDKILYILRERM